MLDGIFLDFKPAAEVFVEQPLASPKSAKYLEIATFRESLAFQISVQERLANVHFSQI